MPPEPTENPETEALVQLGIETNEKLESIEKASEAAALASAETTDAVKGLEPALEAIAMALSDDEDATVEDGAVVTLKGRRGPPGKDAKPEDVAAVLAADSAFKAGLKGDKGDTPIYGEDYFTPEDEARLLKEATPVKGVDYFDQDDLDVIVAAAAEAAAPLVERPEDGKDAKPEDVAALLKQDLDFIAVTKGGKGDNGSPDTGIDIVKKITKLEGTDRLSYKSLKDRPDIPSGNKNPGGGGGQDITALDETTVLTTVLKQLQFVGAGVTAVSIVDGVVVVTIPGAAAGTNIATETVIATDAGGNAVNIDLTQLSQVWQTVEFVARNGAIQNKSKWSIVGDVLTLQGAVTTNDFQIQFTYA